MRSLPRADSPDRETEKSFIGFDDCLSNSYDDKKDAEECAERRDMLFDAVDRKTRNLNNLLKSAKEEFLNLNKDERSKATFNRTVNILQKAAQEVRDVQLQLSALESEVTGPPSSDVAGEDLQYNDGQHIITPDSYVVRWRGLPVVEGVCRLDNLSVSASCPFGAACPFNHELTEVQRSFAAFVNPKWLSYMDRIRRSRQIIENAAFRDIFSGIRDEEGAPFPEKDPGNWLDK